MESKIEFVGKVSLHYEYYSGNDLYQDGAEDELLNIVRNYEEKEYNKVIDEKKSWPILYHLSDVRENIISWIPISKDDKVLEVGAGCGAITGALAQKAGKVDCIELSQKRSLINAERHKRLDNIAIYVGNFQDIEENIKEKYDYITLIGVLEYAGSYISAYNPYVEFLSRMKKHLKEDGKIIIAIENKFGLKYWAGCQEDHLCKFFKSLEGYADSDGVKTFSKNGLQKLCEYAGFNDIVFYYPYPDYKLPMTIYSDEFLPEKGALININNLRNFDFERMVLFNEAKVYDNLIEDGMFSFFSNSYLVILGENK